MVQSLKFDGRPRSAALSDSSEAGALPPPECAVPAVRPSAVRDPDPDPDRDRDPDPDPAAPSHSASGEFPSDARIGTRLDNYLITGILGRGGMGVVYEAENVVLKRKAAVKLMPPARADSERAVERFLQEARSAARLNHPNVVGIYDVGTCRGTVYIAMELVRGGNADEFLERQGAFHWKEATRIAADACRALAAAHAAGLVHRDVKPGNIMRAEDGSVKITDFGLAKATDGSGKKLTASMKIVGTPDYLSPEQGRARPLDGRSDIYSLGATYFALLTGRPPFVRPGGAMEVIVAHLNEPPPDPRAFAPDIPGACAEIVAKAMSKHPDDRHQDADEMRMELEAALAADEGSDAGATFGWGRVRGTGSDSGKRAAIALAAAAAPVVAPPRPAARAGLSQTGILIGAGLAVLAGLAIWLWPKGSAKPPAGAPETAAAVVPPHDPPVRTKSPPAVPDPIDPGPIKSAHRKVPATKVPEAKVSEAKVPESKIPATKAAETKTSDPEAARPAVVSAADAGDWVGKACVVEFRVKRVGKSRTGAFWYLDSDANPANLKSISIAVTGAGQDGLKALGVADFAALDDRFVGKTVRVTGTVKLYKDHPQIIVDEPGRIEILD